MRIDRYLYKFTVNNSTYYKLDFVPYNLNATSSISYKKYKAYHLEMSGRFNELKPPEDQVLLTFLHIIRDFLQKKVNIKAMLLKQDKLLNDDLFELKSQFDLECLKGLFEEGVSMIYLVKAID